MINKKLFDRFALSLALAIFALPLLPLLVAASESNINVWWPTNGAHLSGTQPFKVQVSGLNPAQYQMYWQVDGGALNQMVENDTDYPHMEASVDVSGWNWHGSGPYTITFVEKQNGNTVGQTSETVYIDGNTPAPAPAPTVAQQPATQPTTQPITTTQTQQVPLQMSTNIAAPALAPAPTPAPAPQLTVSAPTTSVGSSAQVSVWWPTSGAQLSGTQPFKAVLNGFALNQYSMYWQVDGGQLNLMQDNYTDAPHKEADVDVSGWSWHGAGPYMITFVAKDAQGTTLAQLSEPIYVGSAPAVSISQPQTTVSPQVQTTSPTVINTVSIAPASGSKLYVDPNSDAAHQAQAWTSSNPTGVAAMQKLAAQPTAVWFGDWNSNVQNDVHNLVSAAAAQGTTPVMVAYDIPQRDCGGYSSGGTNNPDGYKAWINSVAAGIGPGKAIVILEPDALAQIGCLSQADQQTRLSLLSYAVSTLKANGNTSVYLDAGHSGWIDPGVMASSLQQAGVSKADGFSLNVSNFNATSDETNYGQQISSKIGGKHFVVDTGRNGNGSNGQWCNPSGRAIGQTPTTSTGNSLVDAYLWIKTPGESDGTCNGGPSAGVWWADYALQLVLNAH